MEFGDQAAKAGIAYNAEEWRKLAAELAGGAWSQNMPSQGTLDMTQRVQNAKAAKNK